MIRDPAFNDLFAPQPPPWGAHGIKPLGHLIPLKAIKEAIPSDEVQGFLKDPEVKSPGEQLRDYCHGQALLEGTWYNLPQAIALASKLSIMDYTPLPPFIIDAPHARDDEESLGEGNGLQVGADDLDEEEIRTVGGNHKWDEGMPDTFLWHEAVTAQRALTEGDSGDGTTEEMRDDPSFTAS